MVAPERERDWMTRAWSLSFSERKFFWEYVATVFIVNTAVLYQLGRIKFPLAELAVVLFQVCFFGIVSMEERKRM